MKTRNLKIEEAGDFWRGRVVPKIRLTGKWLERAGFKPGNRVEVQMSGQGTLTLRFLPPSPCHADTAPTQIQPGFWNDTHLTQAQKTTQPDTAFPADYCSQIQQYSCNH